jgi:hypothetical protein
LASFAILLMRATKLMEAPINVIPVAYAGATNNEII